MTGPSALNCSHHLHRRLILKSNFRCQVGSGALRLKPLSLVITHFSTLLTELSDGARVADVFHLRGESGTHALRVSPHSNKPLPHLTFLRQKLTL